MIGIFILAGLAVVAYMIFSSSDSGSSVIGSLEQGLGIGSAPSDPSNPNDPLTLATALIKAFESFSPTAYNDPPGSSTYSIGYGHQIKPSDPYNQNSTMSESEASDLLHVDAGGAWNCVHSNVTADCSPQQLAAMISLCYNIGCGAFQSSSVLRDVNAGDPDAAAEDFLLWNKVTGPDGTKIESAALTARRTQEQSIFQGGATA